MLQQPPPKQPFTARITSRSALHPARSSTHLPYPRPSLSPPGRPMPYGDGTDIYRGAPSRQQRRGAAGVGPKQAGYRFAYVRCRSAVGACSAAMRIHIAQGSSRRVETARKRARSSVNAHHAIRYHRLTRITAAHALNQVRGEFFRRRATTRLSDARYAHISRQRSGVATPPFVCAVRRRVAALRANKPPQRRSAPGACVCSSATRTPPGVPWQRA